MPVTYGRITYLQTPETVDVAAIRNKVRTKARRFSPVPQDEFAYRYGFSLSAVKDWEQGRRMPSAAARTLLMMIAKDQKAVDRILDLPE